jgi:hypothetical protein
MLVTADIDSERPISFNEAGRYLPESSRPSYATWWRWWRKGIKGVRLQTVVIGGRRFTTPRYVEEFIAATTAAAAGERPTTRTPAQREREIRRAEAEMGIPMNATS